MLVEAIEMIENIRASDPPYDFKGKFWTTKIRIRSTLALGFGWLPKPYQKPRPPIAIPFVSRFGFRGGRRPQRLERRSRARCSRSKAWPTTGRCIAGLRGGGSGADGADWRICRSILVAGTDEEARRARSAGGGYRHFFGHMHKVLKQLGRLVRSRRDRTCATKK